MTDKQKQKELITFLRSLGCKKQIGKDFYVLDGWDHEGYFLFDATICEDTPNPGTADIYFIPVGEYPIVGVFPRLKDDCTRFDILRMISAFGVNRFSDEVKKVYYKLADPLRGR